MTARRWTRDTIAWRFAITVAVAAIVTLGLVRLVIAFGGTWARPEIEETGLPQEAAAIIRVIEAAPVALRPHLASAASVGAVQVDWYESNAPAAAAFKRATDGRDGRPYLVGMAAGPDWPSRVFGADSEIWSIPALAAQHAVYPEARFIAVMLPDSSWLTFMTLTKSWGLPTPERWAIWIAFLALSIGIVSSAASRQLARPIQQLADAVRSFGLNPQMPPLADAGPEELRQVIRTFNAMQAKIQKFVADRTTMLAAISHDLRTPLTRIRLRGEFIEDAEQRAKLFRDVDEMQAMVDGALAFFRDDAVDEAATAFDLPGLLEMIVNDYADQGIGVRYFGPARCTYRGRPYALKRAFTNLVENAVRYGTPPEVVLSQSEAGLVVTVRDCGPGIPPEALYQVFSPFFRLDRSRNRATGGIGLGLTAAQSIIRAHGGEISLRNRAEGGLEASASLPATTPPSGLPSRQDAVTPHAPGKPLRL